MPRCCFPLKPSMSERPKSRRRDAQALNWKFSAIQDATIFAAPHRGPGSGHHRGFKLFLRLRAWLMTGRVTAEVLNKARQNRELNPMRPCVLRTACRSFRRCRWSRRYGPLSECSTPCRSPGSCMSMTSLGLDAPIGSMPRRNIAANPRTLPTWKCNWETWAHGMVVTSAFCRPGSVSHHKCVSGLRYQRPGCTRC